MDRYITLNGQKYILTPLEEAVPIKTWLDKDTGLEWAYTVDTADKVMTWQEALDYASNLGDNWRIPTVKELSTLLDYSNYNPAVKDTVTFMGSSHYWSSTPYTYNSSNAWGVYYYDGSVGNVNKSYSYCVCCVRDTNTPKLGV